MISDNQKTILEEIVNFNMEKIKNYDGDVNKALDDIFYFNYNENTIWNPFLDVTGRYEVNPEKEYGEDNIQYLINNFKN